MATLSEDIIKIRERRAQFPEIKDLVPSEAELRVRKTILTGGEVIKAAPKKNFFERAKDFITRKIIRRTDPTQIGFTQADVDKVGLQNFIDKSFGDIGKTFPFLFKKEIDKIDQRIESLVKTGTDPERAQKIAMVDVLSGKGDTLGILKKQQQLRSLNLTKKEKTMLRRKNLFEIGGVGLDIASFTPIGFVSRASKISKTKPVIDALRKGEDVVDDLTKGSEIILDKPITVFRGEGRGIGNVTFVRGRFFADSKEFASTFGKVSEHTIPKGTKIFDFDTVKDINQKIIPKQILIDPELTRKFLKDRGFQATKNTNVRGVEYALLDDTGTDRLMSLANTFKTKKQFLEEVSGPNFRKYSDDLKEIKTRDLSIGEIWNKAKKLDLKGKPLKDIVGKPPIPPQNIAKTAGEFSKNTPKGVPFELADETKREYLVRQIQDKMNRLEGIQVKITKAGGKIDEGSDAYLAQELYVGKAAENIDALQRYLIKDPAIKGGSFLERLTKDKIKVDEFGKYLQARHAAERNTQVGLRNPKLLDGGSGMLTKEAEKTIVNFTRAGKIKSLEKFADEFYSNITNARLELLVKSGLETPETAAKLRTVYKNYVPLKVETKRSSFGQRGKGFSVSGKDIKRARGSTVERSNPFIQAILDYENTLIKAEKNKVGLTFLKLVQENPNPKVWKAERMKYSPRFDKTGEVISMDPKFKFADNVMEVREKGKIWTITIEDEALAKAMKNLGTERGFQSLNVINNYLRGINTFMNPEFMITNFERDIQTALINIGGEHGGKMAKNVISDVRPAMAGIWRNVRGKKGKVTKDGEDWAKLYQEMKEEGGRVGWFEIQTVEEKTRKLTNQINRYQSKKTIDRAAKMVDSVGEYVVSMNEVVESAVRLSAYKNAVAAGMSKGKAAQLAKNLTVNFNKKGNLGVFLNSLYLFSNAGIQGTARIFSALKHPGTRRIVIGIMAGNFANNESNRIINAEAFEKIPDHIKDTNIIFMHPNGTFNKIRLPYGYNIFKSASDVMGEYMHGEITEVEAMKRMVLAADAAFNPLSSGTLLQFGTPTVLDPLVQQIENKNFFGGPIKPEQLQFGPKKPESQLYWKSGREVSKETAQWLNKVTGGTEVEAGKIDISPEIMDHWWDFLTGGVGKFVANSYETGKSVLKGDMPDTRNMPFVRQMIGKPFEEFERFELAKIAEASATKELTSKELADFKKHLKTAFKTDQIDDDRTQQLFDTVMRNQARIFAGRVLEDMEDMSVDEKRAAFKEMSTLEKKEFSKLFDKRLEKAGDEDIDDE